MDLESPQSWSQDSGHLHKPGHGVEPFSQLWLPLPHSCSFLFCPPGLSCSAQKMNRGNLWNPLLTWVSLGTLKMAVYLLRAGNLCEEESGDGCTLSYLTLALFTMVARHPGPDLYKDFL